MKQLKIAITGGIGSGKSTVLRILKEKGFLTFSCDEIYKEIIEQESFIRKIVRFFPEAVINEKINRKILSDIVFHDEKKRKRLNSITHPLIMQTLLERMTEAREYITFAEVPLLFEIGAEKKFDYIWVVTRSLTSRIGSVQERDGVSKADVEARIAAQFDYNSKKGIKKLSAPNISIINNPGAIELLSVELDKMLKNLEQCET